MKQVVLFICFAGLLVSCGRRHKCVNTNPIFNQFGPDDREYKAELIRQLKLRDQSHIHFYVDKYIERAHKPFMTIFIEGDSLCAKGILDIKNENKLQDFKTVKGLTYAGAELINFQYTIDSTYGSYNFIWEEGELKK